jgi:hypothetical protein
VVEGGTLLRCYTSQRGIEGSNPSSSAPKAPRLQEQREGEEVGRVHPWLLLHQRVHQRRQNTLFRGHEHRIRIRVFVSTATISSACPLDATWPRSTKKGLSACYYAGCWIWISENPLPRTPVHKQTSRASSALFAPFPHGYVCDAFEGSTYSSVAGRSLGCCRGASRPPKTPRTTRINRSDHGRQRWKSKSERSRSRGCSPVT